MVTIASWVRFQVVEIYPLVLLTKKVWVVDIGLSPLSVTVTTRIITFLVGDPYKPSFPLLLGGGTTQCRHQPGVSQVVGFGGWDFDIFHPPPMNPPRFFFAGRPGQNDTWESCKKEFFT